MRVAERYVNKELFLLFFFILSFLLLVVVGGRFLSYLEEASLGFLSSGMALGLVMYRLPEFLQVVAPFALFFAVLLTLSRLYAESEMAIFHSAGVGTLQIAKWLCIAIIPVTLLVGLFSILFTPKVSSLMEEYLLEQREISTFEMINAGNFHTIKKGTYTIHSQETSEDGVFLKNIFLFERIDSRKDVVIWARLGEIEVDEETGSRFLRLNDGVRYEGRPGEADYRVVEFQTFVQEVEPEGKALRTLELSSTHFLDLDESSASRGEFHWRIGLPIFCFIGAFLAVGLAKTKPRQGRYAKIVPAAISIFSYYLLLLFNHNAIVENSIAPELGLWFVHLLYGGLAVWFCRKSAMPSRV